MNEVKLNLVDCQQILSGKIHGSVADRSIAALSAEPETIAELAAALDRYEKRLAEHGHFSFFQPEGEIDSRPWDAGIVVIDLAARIVAIESTYSSPDHQGHVDYHNGETSTDVPVPYRVPDDWLFVESIVEYEAEHQSRKEKRSQNSPLDARAVLFGRALLEFVATSVRERCEGISQLLSRYAGKNLYDRLEEAERSMPECEFLELYGKISSELSSLHSVWLMTPRDDLLAATPREVLFAKRDFIDYDMHTRSMQWSLLGEGPPCLSQDSFAFRFAGFGTHEWVIYYDLVRYLLWNSLNSQLADHYLSKESNPEGEIAGLEQLKVAWLEHPQSEYDGRIPIILIENERRRLPIAMSASEVIIDDDCPACQLMAEETTLGNPTFWHLDGSHMEDEFVFSYCATLEDWEEEQRLREEYEKQWEVKRDEAQRVVEAEVVEAVADDPF